MRSLLSAILIGIFVVIPLRVGYVAELPPDENSFIDGGIFILTEELEKEKDDFDDLEEVFQESKEVKESIPVAEQVQAREQMEWAVGELEIARQNIDLAKKATNIAQKQYYFNKAKDHAEKARNWKRRAHATVSPQKAEPAQEPAQPKRKGSLQFGTDLTQRVFGSEAFQQALAIKRKQRGFTERKSPQMADAINFDSQSGVLTTSTGTKVDITPVVEAVNRVLGTFKKKDIFETVPLPEGGEVFRLKPEVKKALSSLKTKEQREKVGGVSLEVTLDLLSFLGLPDFRTSGPTKVVENPVLISLNGLYQQVSAYAGDQTKWNKLPSALRYPGGIERIHGFVLDPENEDIFLVGASAKFPEDCIDIDSLIVGLKTVWAEGSTPAVSLEPLPDAIAGPQYVRVFGMPQDTTFAKIMLDADYLMKRITFGDLEVDVAGFRSLKDLLAGQRQSSSAARSWFYPMALGADGIHISSTERSVLFETEVQLLTEEVRIVASGFESVVSSGDSYDLQVCKLFTEHYGEFENLRQVKPSGIFLRLHGLVDIVTMCKLWRSFGLNYSILDQFSKLPLSDLEGDAAVPTYYPGITTIYAKQMDREWFIMGGVQIKPRATRRSLDQYQDVMTLTLEDAVDTFPRKRKFAKSIVLSLSLPRVDVASAGEIEQIMTAGRTALVVGQFEAARTKFKEVTKKDPFYAEAWLNLARAESSLGNHQAAAAGVKKALSEDPGDPGFYMTALDILMKGGQDIDLYAWDEAILRDMSVEFTIQSFFALKNHQDTEAREYAETAVYLWEDNPDAYYCRATALARLRLDRWSKDLERAIRLYRRQIRLTGDKTNRHKLAFALAWRAKKRLIDIPDLDQALADPVETKAVLYQMQRAVDDAVEAVKLDPALPLALVMEAEARAHRVSALRTLGRQSNLDPARQAAQKVVKQFPDYSPGYRARAMVLELSEEFDGAIEALSEAIRLDPTLGGVLANRALLSAEQGNCSAADADSQRARELGISFLPGTKEAIKQWCQ